MGGFIEKDGKIYANKNIEEKSLRKFRKKQNIILAGKLQEDIYVDFKDGRRLFVNAGEYVYLDVDNHMKTMNAVDFEKNHEIENKIEFVTIKVRKEVENKIKEFTERFLSYKGQVSDQAIKVHETRDVNIISGHLLLAGIEHVSNELNVLDEVNKSYNKKKSFVYDPKSSFAK